MVKPKKRKSSYQKSPTGVKVDNIINEVSSSEPNKKNKYGKEVASSI